MKGEIEVAPCCRGCGLFLRYDHEELSSVRTLRHESEVRLYVSTPDPVKRVPSACVRWLYDEGDCPKEEHAISYERLPGRGGVRTRDARGNG